MLYKCLKVLGHEVTTMTENRFYKAAFCFSLFAVAIFTSACSGGKNKSLTEMASASGDYESENVNAIQQALPTIMVLPSDNLLEEYNSLKTQTIDGRKFVLRDYQQYLLANNDNPQILSTVQGAFVDMSYPLNDLEQTLKQLNTEEATDMADNLEKDSKTLLLATAQPDIILELDYKNKMDLASHNVNKRELSYTIRAIDAYTNKVVATASEIGIENSNAVEIFQKSLNGKLPKLSEDIIKYFSDILRHGREVTVRVAVEKGSNVKLSDENVEGDTYSDWIVDYLNTHTIKGTYKMQRNSDNEIYFVNVRIALLNEDGTQNNVYDWAREFRAAIRKNLGVKAPRPSSRPGSMS